MPEPRGSLYDLELLEGCEFRASGLDAAYRITRRLDAIVTEALRGDPEVLELIEEPILRGVASPKNFAPRREPYDPKVDHPERYRKDGGPI